GQPHSQPRVQTVYPRRRSLFQDVRHIAPRSRTAVPTGLRRPFQTIADPHMDVIGVIASVVYQFCTNAAFLLLCALGLIVILGMMNIINLAHGELMMMGAYAASATYSRGAPFWLAAIIAFVAVGIFGAVLEATIVRRFYGREIGALVVTRGVRDRKSV